MLMSKKKIRLAVFDVNQTIFNLNEIKNRFKKKKINPLLVDSWFISTLKEGFASSTPKNFLSFTEIAKEELKKLIIQKKKDPQILKFLFSGFKNLKANHDIKNSFRMGLRINLLVQVVPLSGNKLRNDFKN